MKVGIIAFSGIYPISIGGPASVGYFVAKWLGELGDDVTVFTRLETRKQADSIGQVKEFKCLKNVDIIPIAMDYKLKTLLNLPYLTYKIYKTTKTFTHEHFDIVYFNSVPIDVTVLFPIMSKLKREKQVLAIHGGIFVLNKHILGRLLIKIEKNLFDAVTVFSNFSRNLAMKAGFKENKIVMIPNGVELELINKSKPLNLPGDPRILYVGRLSKFKNVHVLLRAFAEVVKQFPRACLYIVGDGPTRGFLQRMAAKLGIRDNVVFKGFIPTTSVYRYYKSVDVLVLPSYVENFSITLLESMASKVPVIASDALGNLEIICNGRNGVIFPRGKHKILSEKMQLVLSDFNFAQKLATNAYEDAEKKYSWKVVVSLYHDMFQSLLA